MGRWLHRLSNVDPEARSGTGERDGTVRVLRRWHRKGLVAWRCSVAKVEAQRNTKGVWVPGRYRQSDRGYRQHKKLACERCGFVPQHRCQLDVNHKSGDHTDNRPENLDTLCSNCHRLVTLAQRDPRFLGAYAAFFAN